MVGNTTIRRRDVLRTATVGAAGVGLLGSADPASARQTCDPPSGSGNYDALDYQFQRDDVYFSEDSGGIGDNQEYAIEVRAALTHLESAHIGGRWQHVFTAGSYITTSVKEEDESNEEYENYRNIAEQSLRIINDEPDRAEFNGRSSPENVGGYPSNTSGQVDSGSAFTVLDLALATTGTNLGVALTAAEATAAIVQSNHGSEADTISWEYGPDPHDYPCEAHHFYRFSFEGRNSTESRCNLTTRHRGGKFDGGSGREGIEFWLNVEADPDSPIMSDDVSEMSTDRYYDYLEESDDFERKSPDEVSISANNNGVDQPIYRAKNPKSLVILAHIRKKNKISLHN